MKSPVQPSFEGTKSIVIPFPGQGTDTSSTRPADVLTDVPRTEVGRTYTFKEAAQLLQCGDESTLRNRYWKEKVEPAFRHCSQPLRSIVSYDCRNQPVYRLNQTGLEVLRAYLAAKSEGRDRDFLMAARQQYPAPPAEPELATTSATVTVEPSTQDTPSTSRYQSPGILSNLPVSSLPSHYSYQSPDENPLVLALQQRVESMQQRNEAALTELQDFNQSRVDTQQAVQTFDDLQAVEAGMAEADRFFWLKEQAKKRRLEQLEAQGRNLGNDRASASPAG